MEKTILTYLLDQLKHHGLSFVLLGLAVWFFFSQNKRLGQDVRDCNDEIIEIYQEQQMQLRDVIEKNTLAFETLQQKLEDD